MIASLCAQTASPNLSVPAQPPEPWLPSASLGLKEAFDENVFLQSVTTNAFRHSAVTTVLPSVGIGYQPSDSFRASLNYAAEAGFFHSDPGEDFILHRAVLSLQGAARQTQWEVSENFVAIDGSDLGPSFFGPGGPPAGGGPQIRDRRAALVERGQVRVTQSLGSWFVRPVVSGYYHDFETVQQLSPGYQNYVDRSDWNAGADFGRQLAGDQGPRVMLGYRYGQETQAKLLDFPEHYDNQYQRALVGLEGNLGNWSSLSISVGPEFRRYAGSVAPGFGDRDLIYPYVDATISLLPSASDVLTLSAKSFQQPGFSGRSAYLDSTYEAVWRHKLGAKLTLGLGLRAYNTDFLKPVDRNDWIVTPSVVAAYAFHRRFGVEVSYLFDDAFSLVPNTQGREYTRQLATLGLKYSL